MKSGVFVVSMIMNTVQLSGGKEAGQEVGETPQQKCNVVIGQSGPMLLGVW